MEFRRTVLFLLFGPVAAAFAAGPDVAAPKDNMTQMNCGARIE